MSQSSFAIAACTALLLLAVASRAQDRFIQDRFAIGFWVDPPLDAEADRHYREIAEANFTLVIGGFGATNPDAVSRQLELCERYGLRAIVSRAGLPADRLPESVACWGYMLRDEPPAGDFPALRAVVDETRAARPGRLTYINILPNYANSAQLGTATYDEHVRRFVDEVDVDVLSMDHYPMIQPGADSRQSYCDNLEAMRVHSLRRGIPYWNFFNSMPYGPHYDPSEHSLRWQIFTTLAYGARGILYFCYWTPRGDEFPKGGAIITAEGRKTRHWAQAQRLNAAVKALGPTLMQLTSEGVVRVKPGDDASQALTGTPLTGLDYGPRGDFLLGLFRHADGRRAVLLNNYDFVYTSWPTVTFDVDPAQVTEVSQETGLEAPVLDDSPDMPGLQLSLDAGGGRLFLLPPK